MQKAVIDLIASRMVEDDTELTIRNEQHKILAKGEWWKDRIYPYYLSKMKGFLWTDSNKIIIDIKEYEHSRCIRETLMQAAGMPGGHNPVIMQSGVTDKQRD